MHAPRAFLELITDPASERHLSAFSPAKPMVLFCATGGRSVWAGKTLKDMGYERVAYIPGGFPAWKEASGPIEG